MITGNAGKKLQKSCCRWLAAMALCLIFFVMPAQPVVKAADRDADGYDTIEGQIEDTDKNSKNDLTKNLMTDFSDESGGAEIEQDDDNIWIEDDVKVSGLYHVRLSDKLASTLSGLSETSKQQIKYTWYRITQDSGATAPEPAAASGTAVTRRQAGDYCNIASSAQYATWLRLDADENDEIWRNDKDRYYYVTVSYPDPMTGTTKTVVSTPVKVNWYSQLENGDFEVPSIVNNAASSDTGSQFRNDYANAVYRAKKGVWQTTGVGTKTPGADIEVVNTTVYGRQTITPPENYGFEDPAAFKAASGDQFVKLNCENAGALYQDVITHPNETLNYSFSHHARGSYNGKNGRKKHKTEYDTVYLVIMPTQLAMTAGSNGTELTSQANLIDFIDARGGFSYSRASSMEDRVIYQDNTSGILIRKVSSSNEAWHHISEAKGYTAKGGLTRFFFVAGPTSWGTEAGSRDKVLNAVNGNLLDNVGFSQALPPSKDFSLTVKKTFSGITPPAVEKMKTGENPYKLTVTIGRESKELTLSGAQLDGVTLTETQNDSQTIFTWTIDDWGVSTDECQYTAYTIKEENTASPETHQRPSQVKINDDILTGADFKGQSTIIYTGNFTDQPEVTIENSYDPNIKLKKTGAAFKIYRINSNNSKEYFISKDSNGIIIWDEVSNGRIFKTAGTDGIVDIGILPRAAGPDGDTYYLEEVKALDAGSQSTQDAGFKVLSDGRVLKINDNDLMTVDYQQPCFLITVKTVENSAGEALPNTGGTGIALFIIIGEIIAICAAAAIARRRQQLAAQTDPHGTKKLKGDKT